jgi:hypothetical protein
MTTSGNQDSSNVNGGAGVTNPNNRDVMNSGTVSTPAGLVELFHMVGTNSGVARAQFQNVTSQHGVLARKLGNFAEGDGNLVFDYGKFMRCKPVPFKGGQELVVNLRWLRQMEMVLESCGCPEDKKVMIVSRELKESVLDWWNRKKVALGTEYISRMSWSSFAMMFEAKYCTPAM